MSSWSVIASHGSLILVCAKKKVAAALKYTNLEKKDKENERQAPNFSWLPTLMCRENTN